MGNATSREAWHWADRVSSRVWHERSDSADTTTDRSCASTSNNLSSATTRGSFALNKNLEQASPDPASTESQHRTVLPDVRRVAGMLPEGAPHGEAAVARIARQLGVATEELKTPVLNTRDSKAGVSHLICYSLKRNGPR